MTSSWSKEHSNTSSWSKEHSNTSSWSEEHSNTSFWSEEHSNTSSWSCDLGNEQWIMIGFNWGETALRVEGNNTWGDVWALPIANWSEYEGE